MKNNILWLFLGSLTLFVLVSINQKDTLDRETFEKYQEISNKHNVDLAEKILNGPAIIVDKKEQPAQYTFVEDDGEYNWELQDAVYSIEVVNNEFGRQWLVVPKEIYDKAKVKDAWAKGKLYPRPELP